MLVVPAHNKALESDNFAGQVGDALNTELHGEVTAQPHHSIG